jgi:hypothetical protein
MKRLFTVAAFALIASLGLFLGSAKADPTFAPASCATLSQTCPTMIYDLNAVGSQLSISNLPFSNQASGGNCTATIYGQAGTWSVDVYTSSGQAFTAVTKVGSLVSPTNAPQVVNIPIASGSGITAVRVQNRAYTSGSPLVGLDCNNVGQVWAPSVEPTPTATP